MAAPVRIANEVFARILRCARADADRECCGLLAGSGGIITDAFPATNAAPTPATAYEIAPQQLFALIREIRAAGLDLLGIYHSHPTGKNEPSPSDMERAYYPDTPYFILSPQPAASQPVRAFEIREGRATELEIQLL